MDGTDEKMDEIDEIKEEVLSIYDINSDKEDFDKEDTPDFQDEGESKVIIKNLIPEEKDYMDANVLEALKDIKRDPNDSLCSTFLDNGKNHLKIASESIKQRRKSASSPTSATGVDIKRRKVDEKRKPAATCEICGKSFIKDVYRNNHLRNVHKMNSKGEKLPDDKHICILCDKKFNAKFSLERHIKNVHFVENKTLSFECVQCGYKTNHKANLKRHLKKHDVCRPNRPLKCSLCKASFNYSKHLKHHERKIHSVLNIKKAPTRRRCPICSFLSSKTNKTEMYNHFQKVHNIHLRWEMYTFNSLQLFYEWKTDLEKETTTFYRERVKSKYYVCHRSGSYKKKGKNLRHIKMAGTCKINAFCPSEIKVNSLENGSFEVRYLPCHIGHENELKFIRLTLEDKRKIASQLLNATPHKSILSRIKTSAQNCDLQRIHLTTKKDLINIEKSFNINNEAIKHPYDPISIEAWVKDLNSDKNTAALHFKPQGMTSNDFPSLKEDEFLLIYMTNDQKTMLKVHSKDVIAIDRTHGPNKYNFQLYTLLVLDESREGFPTAFMFTNKSDEDIVRIFFEKIKETCSEITPNVFMSDMDETLYAGWCKVMGPAKLQIFCTWHVLKAWRGNLNKIKSRERKDEVYKVLKTLLYELDKDNFHKLLDAAMKNLKNNDETKEYYKYFEDHYVKNTRYEHWAYCYCIKSGINTNMSLENFNKVLKYCYLRGKKIERLDKTFCDILNILREKLSDWFIKMKKEKIVNKLKILRQRHKKSLLILDSRIITISNDTWQVLSSTEQEFYTVKKTQDCSKCQLQCIHCESCFHEYTCSCMDCAIKNNMCKHIHLVARNLRNKQEVCGSLVVYENDNSSLIGDDFEECEQLIEEVMLSEVIVEDYPDEEKMRKDIFSDQLRKFVDYCNENAKTKEQMAYLENIMQQAMSTIDAMASTS